MPNGTPDPTSMTIAEIMAAFGTSRRSVQRRLRELAAAGLLKTVAPGGGRGKVARFDAKAIRQHFGGNAARPPTPAAAVDDGEIPEPQSYSSFVASWAAYRKFQESKQAAARAAAARGDHAR